MNDDWNNELKIDFTVVTIPSLYTPINGPKIFLAGSIDCDNENHWRKDAIEHIRTTWFEDKDNKNSITIYSPRSEEPWIDGLENEQTTWNISMMNGANYIILHLTGNSLSPISLLELGIYATNPKLYFSITDDYLRKNIAELYYSCYGVNIISKSIYESILRIKNNWINKQ